MPECRFFYNSEEINLNDSNLLYYSSNFKKSNFYENDFLEYISQLEIGGDYLDIGTHIGNHAIFFALFSKARKVFGFEPINEYRQIAIENVSRNNLEGVVTVFKDALGEDEKEVTISIDGKSQVSIVGRLDDHEASKADIALMKIDVEGMEPNVLRGAIETINRNRPIIFLEVIQEENADRYSSHELTEILDKLDYIATGRAFNFQPTLEFIPKEKLSDFTEKVGRKEFALGRLQHSNPKARIEIICQGEAEITAPASQPSWFGFDLSDFDTCGDDPDITFSHNTTAAFLEIEAYHKTEVRFYVIINAYKDGELMSQSKKYINRRAFIPISDVEKSDSLRVLLFAENGTVSLKKLSVTQVLSI